MKKTFAFVLLLMMFFNIPCASAEGGSQLNWMTFVKGQSLTIVDTDEIKITLDGKVNDNGFMLELGAVVQNKTNHSIKLRHTGTVNGWSISKYLDTVVQSNAKAKCNVWFAYEEFDFKKFAGLEQVVLTFMVENDKTGTEYFNVPNVAILFNGAQPDGTTDTDAVSSAVTYQKVPEEGIIQHSFVEMTVENMAIRDEVKFSGYSGGLKMTSGLYQTAGVKYAFAQFKLKNLNSSEYRPMFNGVVLIDGNEYELDSYIISNFAPTFSVEAKEDVICLLYAKIPASVATAAKDFTIRFGFDDDFTNSVFTEMDSCTHIYEMVYSEFQE